MDLSAQQSEAFDVVRRWWEADIMSPVCRVFGFAGTGKTTIAKQFAELVDGRVIFAAYTGKAAHVLETKGCVGARTIHSLIYIPKTRSAARLRELREELSARPPGAHRDLEKAIKEEEANLKRPSFALNLDSELRSASLLVVDEVSMVDEQMARDLMSFDIPILVLGDPAQLPPVRGSGYFIDAPADYLLTEIHRQGKESKILELATDIREGRGYDRSKLTVPKGRMKIADLADFEQVLVGTNKTRRIINAEMREYLGFQAGVPVTGDRLICTRNDGETGLLNGSQWEVLSCQEVEDGRLLLGIRAVDGETTHSVVAHPHTFRGEEIPYYEMREAQCFEFAYAITVHKSQGSEWSTVCVVDEAHKFSSDMRRSWRYTAITRASERLVVIR